MIYQIPAGTGFEMRRKIFPALVFPPVLWYAGIRQKTTGVDTMAEQEMLLDTATIRAAVAGEKWAKVQPMPQSLRQLSMRGIRVSLWVMPASR